MDVQERVRAAHITVTPSHSADAHQAVEGALAAYACDVRRPYHLWGRLVPVVEGRVRARTIVVGTFGLVPQTPAGFVLC